MTLVRHGQFRFRPDGLPDGDDDVVINADVSLPSANCNGSIFIGAAGNLILNSQSYKLFMINQIQSLPITRRFLEVE